MKNARYEQFLKSAVAKLFRENRSLEKMISETFANRHGWDSTKDRRMLVKVVIADYRRKNEAMLAIGKRRAKQVRYSGTGVYCDCCHSELSRYGRKLKYCPECGQKLEWED